jgi:hypothetical protein
MATNPATFGWTAARRARRFPNRHLNRSLHLGHQRSLLSPKLTQSLEPLPIPGPSQPIGMNATMAAGAKNLASEQRPILTFPEVMQLKMLAAPALLAPKPRAQ